MTEVEADFLSATVHLLHAASAADAAAGSLFTASKYHYTQKQCRDLILRINQAVKEIDAIRDDVTILMTHGCLEEKGAGEMIVQITEKQAEILKDLQKTCQERTGVPWTTYTWEVYARTIREVLESARMEQSE